MANYLLLLAPALLATVYSACQSGWRPYNGHCYRFQTDKESWTNARQMCLWHKSHLINIDDAAEQKWFHDQALTFNHTDGDNGFWLGGTNWNNDANWIWEIVHKPITYTNWDASQPNNRDNSELCMASIKLFDYRWSDEFCEWDVLQYVCEQSEGGDPIIG
ncbi:perlucin-like protein [Ruditapes philippinarum]|uniref:perlucin-like protein n=1 Tax=Ruditapes philippinarum TaxID=129788 RepID=UPI00295A86BA|nr:perlucin-like protein [Ruditapes philippinarum]